MLHQFFKELFCWHDWSPWKEERSKWASAFSIFAMPGSDLRETTLVKVTESRYCKKCRKHKSRNVREYFERNK